MKRIVTSIWDYFKEMNSEKGGGVSIKRNIAWGNASQNVFVQVFSLLALYWLILAHPEQKQLVQVFKWLCVVYVSVNAIMVLLALGITSLEKITTFAKTIKGDSTDTAKTPDSE